VPCPRGDTGGRRRSTIATARRAPPSGSSGVQSGGNGPWRGGWGSGCSSSCGRRRGTAGGGPTCRRSRGSRRRHPVATRPAPRVRSARIETRSVLPSSPFRRATRHPSGCGKHTRAPCWLGRPHGTIPVDSAVRSQSTCARRRSRLEPGRLRCR
jgi:hypothetical protein